MSAQRGNVYETRNGYGIRWREGDQRRYQSGFKTKTEARTWFREQVAPRLHRGAPSAEIRFDRFCDVYLARWEPTVAKRTRETLREWLAPARARFGDWKLSELEHATDDVARWRATLPTDHARYRNTRALRQVLAAAVRWGYLAHNAALDFGKNAAPQSEEVKPFTREQVDAIAEELGPRYGPLVIFAVETGLRTNEWIALERKDVDREAGVVIVRQRVTDGVHHDAPKAGQRRRVPLTPRALGALKALPPRLDCPLVFPALQGGYINLDHWRMREWYPALEAAGIEQRGPYALRHTFASEALRAGISIFELARIMGSSMRTIDKHYGHLVEDSEEHIRTLLAASGR